MNEAKINILLVDDQPAKLLSLETILADLGENVIQARSAEEALKVLLATEVAVVLVDVCMPRMDGFELAELIRDHPRFKRTAIIFISAVHLTDADRLRGYGLGAVDYIPVPIIPEMLRAKVAVFADLYRKTEQLERLNRELENRVAERTADLEATNTRLRETERRYRELVHALPVAVFTCDAEGQILLYNNAAREMWGQDPGPEDRIWCGWNLFQLDGTPLPRSECPTAVTIREGKPCHGREILIERPDGSRRHALPHPEPMFDSSGQVVGAVNMLLDITERVKSEAALRESEDRFRTMADGLPLVVWMHDIYGQQQFVNATFCRFFGVTREEMKDHRWKMILHPADEPAYSEEFLACVRDQRTFHATARVKVADGSWRWIESWGEPRFSSSGEFLGFVGASADITEKRAADEELELHRHRLEDLVEQRTRELATTNERLRMADRMATIGTLSTGLGHDMANLLLPVRMRLESINRNEVSPAVQEDLQAIGNACEYLQRLSKSLRLLALDPQNEDVQHAETDIRAWWEDAEGMIRNGLPRQASLTAEFAPDLPRVRLGKAGLTQMVFNLVQNAGDVLAGRANGRVVVSAEAEPDGRSVRIRVQDNGPGMDAETRARCIEPFFTTKTRGMSTGLGLSLVGGILQRVGGTMEIVSELGRGTEFRITVPVAAGAGRPVKDAGGTRGRRAVISLSDARLGAYLESVLTGMSFQVRHGDGPGDADLWITTAESATPDVLSGFAVRPDRRAVVFNASAENGDRPGVIHLDPRLKPSQLSARLRTLLAETSA
jgi:PAS domain S-box-containing protein